MSTILSNDEDSFHVNEAENTNRMDKSSNIGSRDKPTTKSQKDIQKNSNTEKPGRFIENLEELKSNLFSTFEAEGPVDDANEKNIRSQSEHIFNKYAENILSAGKFQRFFNLVYS